MKNNQKIKMLLLKIIIILIAILIIAYIIFEVGNLLLQPTDIVTVENGKISSETSTEGYIIREETVLKGENYKNGMSQIKAEGEKISVNENAFRYYTKDEESLNNKIKELDNKIAEAQSEENNIFSSDVKVIENEIENKINIKKHGISFKSAARIFFDYDRIEYYDEEHSYDEDRYNTIGDTSAGKVVGKSEGVLIGNVDQFIGRGNEILFVVYTERVRIEKNGLKTDVTRLISARLATDFERGLYYGKNY